MKATEQYFPVVLFIMLYKLVLTFEASYEATLHYLTLWCGMYILLTKREGRTGRISAGGLDSTDRA